MHWRILNNFLFIHEICRSKNRSFSISFQHCFLFLGNYSLNEERKCLEIPLDPLNTIIAVLSFEKRQEKRNFLFDDILSEKPKKKRERERELSYRACRQWWVWRWTWGGRFPLTVRYCMVGWSRAVGLITDDGRVVVLVEVDICCWAIEVRLNFAIDGEQEPRSERFKTSVGGRGSWRGKQRSCNGAARGDVWPPANQAAGTIGKIKRRLDKKVPRWDVGTIGVFGVPVGRSFQWTFEPLVEVHVDEKLALLRSVRRGAPSIVK